MIIYRIEHGESGRGAFAAGLARTHDEFSGSDHSAYDHPGPIGEWDTELHSQYMRGELDSHYFGCRSKTQLRSWFRSSPGRRAMAKAGGVMVTYEAPREAIAMGRTQLAFDMNRATKLSSVPADQW
ncbi:hypothetical protein IB265_34855 [Ensifer sp. ENS10]|uniref:hypothetical protein n=1 Tax=Ensifer sp. ENS10 TaxID=2769286 RepID=UPI00177B3C12|nr:hypothetical protein [Ensifer sp. ENS10]MBD9511932.1 hypothetical protein [Ensifer sp. ENS10]